MKPKTERRSRLEDWLRRRRPLVLGMLTAAALPLAWLHRFVQDDAFISFTYARSLAQGHGLTWFGTRVEGYTNFLWVLWISLGFKLGIEPITWSYVGGLLAFAAVVYGTGMLAFLVFPETVPGLLAVLFLVTNYSILSYATSGLETMLQTAFLCLAMLQLCRILRNRVSGISGPLALSLFLAGAVLTRLDSSLPGAIIGIAALVLLVRQRAGWKSYAAIVLPFAVIVGVWLAWKLSFYGRILPNTYYVKTQGGLRSLANGFNYLYRFFSWYFLLPFLVMGGLVFAVRRRAGNRLVLPLLVVVLAWCAYIIAVGADFMEFRFMVTIAPFVAILAAWLVYYQLGVVMTRRPVWAGLVMLAVIVPASIHHGRTFLQSPDGTLDGIPYLATFYGVYPDHDWSKVGASLKRQFDGVDVTIATGSAGAVPYYSDMRTIDMFGLSDTWVAAHGRFPPGNQWRPGHFRLAPLSYLRQQKVNLMVGRPTIVRPRGLASFAARDSIMPWLRSWDVTSEMIPEVTVLDMPIDQNFGLLMWYLTPTQEIDDRIRSRGWETQTYYNVMP
jgi:arabinofuranosyltransferase